MAENYDYSLNATNAQIMDAIRLDASLAYQQRVPAATQGDITSSIESLTSYKPALNEFVDALINRIGDVIIKSKIWNNPLAQFKRGMMQYGETIEEVYVNILEAKRFDPNVSYEDVFKVSPPDVRSNFHTINRQDRYDVTLNERLLRRAFLTEYGLQDLVGRVLETPYTSDYYDEYLIMKNLFKEYNDNDYFWKIQVPDISTAVTQDDTDSMARKITTAIRAQAGKMRFMSANWNTAGVTTHTPPEDLVLFVTPEVSAVLDVNVIAYAFNVNAANLPMRVVEVDDFGIDGCVAILADRDFFVAADTLISFESIYNPKGLAWNYFLHHWGVYSVSRFVNAVMFTTQQGSSITVPNISVTGMSISSPEQD